jgi:hypothetical protein
MKLLATIVLALSLFGCGAIMQALPVVAGVLSDASQTLEVIDVAVQEWIRTTNPPEQHRIKYAKIKQNAHRALSTATHTVQGASDLDQKQYDAAFAEFKQAFGEMKSFLEDTGAMGGGALSASGEAAEIPEPLALTAKIE